MFSYSSTTQIRKRPSSGNKPKQKRLRVQASQILHQSQPKPCASKAQPVQSVFEQAVGKPQQPSKIGVKLADTISAIFEAGPQRLVAQHEEKTGRENKNNSVHLSMKRTCRFCFYLLLLPSFIYAENKVSPVLLLYYHWCGF